MSQYILVSKKTIKKNELLKQMQKKNQGRRFSLFISRYPKSSIPKIVENQGFMDLISEDPGNDYTPYEEGDLLKNIKRANLTGRSGNGFPVYKKLETFLKSPQKDRKIIINAVECDPGLIHDEWLLKNRAKEIAGGIHALQKLLNAKTVVLAKKESVEFQSAGIDVVSLPNLYPLGEEHILIKKVLGISLEKKVIPAQKGILVINVQTIMAIQEIEKHAYIEGSKYITAADYTTGEAKVIRIKAGMKAAEVLQEALGSRAGKERFSGGGALSGSHLIQENELTTEDMGMLAYGRIIDFAGAKSCVHCGSCSRNCPMNIPVKRIVNRKGKNIDADISDLKVDQCIKCATCTYQCHAGIDVMSYVQQTIN